MSEVRLIMLIFFLQPLAFGNWLARIPEVQLKLGLEPAELAVTLLGLPAGILFTLPFGGRIVARFGVKRVLATAFIGLLAAICLPGLAFDGPALFAALVVCGVGMSLVELAMNIEAARIEAHGGRLIMSTCHGCWSVGVGAGSAIGAVLASFALPAAVALPVGSLAVLPFAIWACRRLPDLEAEAQAEPEKASFFVRPPLPLVLICLFIFGIAMTEGAMADWSGIFLRDAAGVGPEWLGYGYGIFATAVSCGRFLGDDLKRRLGAVALARLCCGIALLGMATLAFADVFATTVAAYALIGFGVSVGFPLAVTATTQIDPSRAATNVATLSTLSILGFLIGPPMIGGIAQFAGIRMGLLALFPVLLLSFLLAASLRPRSALTRPATA